MLIGAIATALAWIDPISAIAVLFPITVGFQSIAILSWSSEHLWFADDRTLGYKARITPSRRCGTFYPSRGSFAAKSLWFAYMLCIAIPERVLVVPADLIAHAHHHVRPSDRSWPYAVWIANAPAGSPETWGCIATTIAVCKHVERVSANNDQVASFDAGGVMVGM